MIINKIRKQLIKKRILLLFITVLLRLLLKARILERIEKKRKEVKEKKVFFGFSATDVKALSQQTNWDNETNYNL